MKRALCRNPALSKELLEKLAKDDNQIVNNEAKLALKNREKFDAKGYKLPSI